MIKPGPPLSRQSTPLSSPPTVPPSSVLPRLWLHLDPHHQQQLAQHLAQLIRRMHQPIDHEEGTADEHP